jgi:catechol 2,3-dioxygenase-like lactoylglutathione lyase family enzyme
MMRVEYVVLYVNDPEACRRFWVEQVGMVEKRRDEVGDFTMVRVGFADQSFAFELVPLEMMKDNPDGLDLATPSIAFQVAHLETTHADLVRRGVQATDVGDHGAPRHSLSRTRKGAGSRSPFDAFGGCLSEPTMPLGELFLLLAGLTRPDVAARAPDPFDGPRGVSAAASYGGSVFRPVAVTKR